MMTKKTQKAIEMAATLRKPGSNVMADEILRALIKEMSPGRRDLTGADLRDASLIGADLTGANQVAATSRARTFGTRA